MEIRKTPTVTIAMPVYNGDKYIRMSLDSILAQTYSDFELIISDNASTDGTETICREYLRRDKRIRYNRFTENLGAAKNYNYLYEMSTGKYFRWSNHDDLWAPTNLEKCIEVLEKDGKVILCYPKTAIIDENGSIIRKYDDNLDLRSSSAKDRFIHFYKNIGLSNVLFGLIRSDILKKTSLLGNYIGSDIILIGELSLYGRFHEIPEYLFYRRFHSKASSSDKSTDSQQEFFDPKTKGKIAFPSLRHPYQHFISISRSPIEFGEKSILYYKILRNTISDRNNIAREFIFNAKRIIRNEWSKDHKRG
jgi:glycosyltransferase involved in cell wall biosynthesis